MKFDDTKTIIYQSEDCITKIEVRMENEIAWLSQAQMVDLVQTMFNIKYLSEKQVESKRNL